MITEQFNELNSVLNKTIDEKNILTEELMKIREEKAKLDEELEILQTEKDDLKRDLLSRKNISDNVKKLNNQLIDLRSSRDVTKAALEKKTKELEELQKEYKKLKRRQIERKMTVNPSTNQSVFNPNFDSRYSLPFETLKRNKQERMIEKCLDKEVNENKKKSKIISELKQQLSSKHQHLVFTEKRLKEISDERRSIILNKQLQNEMQKLKHENYVLKRKLMKITLDSPERRHGEEMTFGYKENNSFKTPRKLKSIRKPYVQISATVEGKTSDKRGIEKRLMDDLKAKKESMKEKISMEVELTSKQLEEASEKFFSYERSNNTRPLRVKNLKWM